MSPLDPKTSIDILDAGLVLVAGRRTDWPAAPGSAKPEPAMVRHMLRSLRDRTDWRGSLLQRGGKAAKYLLRMLRMPMRQARFLATIAADATMRAYQRRDPRVVERHFHRYITRHWDTHTRLDAIESHYRFLRKVMPEALFHAVYADGGAMLGEIEQKDGSSLKLCLRPPIDFGCEGELTIQLCDTYELPLYRIVLTAIGGARPTLAVGSIQGPGNEAGRQAVRDLTRNLHGMRPKDLMLALARAFARHHRFERILAVGNHSHPLRGRHGFVADYDAFWWEHGRMAEGGWFELPVNPIRKSIADVSSRHRSAFRRREALRLHAEGVLTDAFAALPSAILNVAPQSVAAALRVCPETP